MTRYLGILRMTTFESCNILRFNLAKKPRGLPTTWPLRHTLLQQCTLGTNTISTIGYLIYYKSNKIEIILCINWERIKQIKSHKSNFKLGIQTRNPVELKLRNVK